MSIPQPSAATVDVRQATKMYGSFTAMKDVDLHVDAGEFITLLGPSGSGKTTTLNAIAGFIDLTSGSLAIGGRAVDGLPAHKRNIGVVFQNYSLFPHMTVERNVVYPLALRKVPQPSVAGWWARRSRWCGCRSSPIAIRASFRAASNSAWPWRGRWSSGHRFY